MGQGHSGNNITFNGGSFGGSATPRIGVSGIGSVIRYNTPTNSYIHKVVSASNLAVFEPFSETKTLDSTVSLTFGNITSGVGTTVKDIKCKKEGGIVTIEFYIQLNGSGGQTGTMRLRNLPYKALNVASGTVALTAGLASGRGMFTVGIGRGENMVTFYKFANPDVLAVNETDITPTAIIRGSITYAIDSQFN